MRTKIFIICILSVILIGTVYLYLNDNNQDKTVTTIPEEERVLVKDGCQVGGCSRQICAEKDAQIFSDCLWSPQYACYKDSYTTCEKQSNGRCSWTNTPEFRACLKSPPSSLNIY